MTTKKVSKIDALASYKSALETAFAERVAKEQALTKEHCASVLRAHLKDINHDFILSMLVENNVALTFINKNEKQIERMNDVLRALAKVAKLNKYAVAMLRTARAFHDAQELVTRNELVACCSKDSARSSARDALIERTATIQSSGTINAQSSMTINALVALNALVESFDVRGKVYKFNADSKIALDYLALAQV